MLKFKVPERERTAPPVVRERLLPERLRRPLPSISERLSEERLRRQLTAMGFEVQPPRAGWKLFSDVGLTDSIFSRQRSPIMRDEFDVDLDDGVRLEVGDGLKSRDG